MKHSQFSKARFGGAFLTPSPPVCYTRAGAIMPEIALIGRSNVGKSSLINHLCNHSKLAKTSSTPGKTQTLNFFVIDESIALVDLPGYGYAKVPLEAKKKWAACLDEYLRARTNLCLLLFLLDSRHPPTEEDLAFIRWATSENKELLLVFTKSDKLTSGEKVRHARYCLKIFGGLNHIYYSIKDRASKETLIHQLEKYLT